MLESYLHSFMIAKILGLWMVILSITMLAKREYFRVLVRAFDEEKVAHFVFASMLTFLGIALVSFHSYWVLNQLLIVTIACWLILLKGILWLAFPEWLTRASQKIVNSPWYWVGAIITLIYGVVLLSYGAQYHDLLDPRNAIPTWGF